jgi:hypothetical protein
MARRMARNEGEDVISSIIGGGLEGFGQAQATAQQQSGGLQNEILKTVIGESLKRQMNPEEGQLKQAEIQEKQAGTALKKSQLLQTEEATKNIQKGASFKWWNMRTNKETNADDPDAQLLKIEPTKSGDKVTYLDKEKIEHRTDHQRTLLVRRGQYLKQLTDLSKNPLSSFFNKSKIDTLNGQIGEIDNTLNYYNKTSTPSKTGHVVGEHKMVNGTDYIRNEAGEWIPQS